MTDRWLGDLLADREADKMEKLQTWAWAQLSWWERRLVKLALRTPSVHRLLAFIYEARALQRWKKAWGESCDVLDMRDKDRDAVLSRMQLLEDRPTQQSVVHFLVQEDDTPTPVRPMPTHEDP